MLQFGERWGKMEKNVGESVEFFHILPTKWGNSTEPAQSKLPRLRKEENESGT